MCKQRKRPDGPLKKMSGIWCRYYGKKLDVCGRPEVITKRRHVSVPSWGLAANVSPELYKKALGHSSHIYRERDNARRSRGRGGTAESRGNHQQRGHRRRATHSQRGGGRRARRQDEERGGERRGEGQVRLGSLTLRPGTPVLWWCGDVVLWCCGVVVAWWCGVRCVWCVVCGVWCVLCGVWCGVAARPPLRR